MKMKMWNVNNARKTFQLSEEKLMLTINQDELRASGDPVVPQD